MILVGALCVYTASAKPAPEYRRILSLSNIRTGVTISLLPSLRRKEEAVLVEWFSFVIKDFRMDHQSEIQNLNLAIRLRYIKGIKDDAYPDFRTVAKDIEDFLRHYPNKKDYWEILNKKITVTVLSKYPQISKVESELKVSPTRGVPYLRSSIVERSRGEVKR